jgi:putative transposase
MSYYRLFYHFVWATKDRLPLITNANREPIYATIRAKTTELHGIVHALNGMDDHVHLVVTIPPSTTLSTFIGQVKGSSSHLANQISSAAFAWQGEYGVMSVSESHLPRVVRYVVMQQQHHTADTLDERLERCEAD